MLAMPELQDLLRQHPAYDPEIALVKSCSVSICGMFLEDSVFQLMEQLKRYHAPRGDTALYTSIKPFVEVSRHSKIRDGLKETILCNFAQSVDGLISWKGHGLTKRELFEMLPSDLPCCEHVEPFIIPQTDKRLALRGKLGIRAKCDLHAGTFIGVYRGVTLFQRSFVSKKNDSLTHDPPAEIVIASYAKEMVSFNPMEHVLKSCLVKKQDREDIDTNPMHCFHFNLVTVASEKRGNLTCLINDPRENPLISSHQIAEANAVMVEIMLGGFWTVQAVFLVMDVLKGEEILLDYGQSYWENYCAVYDRHVSLIRSRNGHHEDPFDQWDGLRALELEVAGPCNSDCGAQGLATDRHTSHHHTDLGPSLGGKISENTLKPLESRKSDTEGKPIDEDHQVQEGDRQTSNAHRHDETGCSSLGRIIFSKPISTGDKSSRETETEKLAIYDAEKPFSSELKANAASVGGASQHERDHDIEPNKSFQHTDNGEQDEGRKKQSERCISDGKKISVSQDGGSLGEELNQPKTDHVPDDTTKILFRSKSRTPSGTTADTQRDIVASVSEPRSIISDQSGSAMHDAAIQTTPSKRSRDGTMPHQSSNPKDQISAAQQWSQEKRKALKPQTPNHPREDMQLLPEEAAKALVSIGTKIQSASRSFMSFVCDDHASNSPSNDLHGEAKTAVQPDGKTTKTNADEISKVRFKRAEKDRLTVREDAACSSKMLQEEFVSRGIDGRLKPSKQLHKRSSATIRRLGVFRGDEKMQDDIRDTAREDGFTGTKRQKCRKEEFFSPPKRRNVPSTLKADQDEGVAGIIETLSDGVLVIDLSHID